MVVDGGYQGLSAVSQSFLGAILVRLARLAHCQMDDACKGAAADRERMWL